MSLTIIFGSESSWIRIVTHEYVRKNQRSLIMDLDFLQLTELVDIKAKPGSHFIHRMSEPFSE